MGKKVVLGKVVSQTCIAPDIYDLRMETELACEAKAGQFVGVYPKNAATLLPRPISICEADAESKMLRLVYRIAGAGTAEFATLTQGDEVRLLGTLGNGFPLVQALGKRVFLMGGGIGIPPMLELAKQLQTASKAQGVQTKVTAILGYRDSQLFLSEDLAQYAEVVIASEDGSVGTKGNVLTAVSENNLSCDVIMACGPMPMLRAIKKYASEQNIKAFISLEERMACGVGACLGCVCKTTKVDDHSKVNNTRICTDGPVFDADDVEI